MRAIICIWRIWRIRWPRQRVNRRQGIKGRGGLVGETLSTAGDQHRLDEAILPRRRMNFLMKEWVPLPSGFPFASPSIDSLSVPLLFDPAALGRDQLQISSFGSTESDLD